MLRVIPALFDSLAAAREAAERSKAEIAAVAGVKERTVDRWEKKEHLPLGKGTGDTGDDLARTVEFYADATDRTPFELWSDALDRAKAAEGKLKRDLGASSRKPSRQTKQAANALGQQSAKRRDRKKARAKGNRGEAG